MTEDASLEFNFVSLQKLEKEREMASVRGNLLGSEKEVEGLNERIQEMTKEAEANHEISKKLQVGFFPHCTIALTSIYFR